MKKIQAITGLPFNIKQFIDITEQLPSRTPDPEPYRKLEQITHISVHHSAVEGGTIEGYANTHVNKNGWAHIGYHLVIVKDQVFQTNDLLTFSYHTSGNNAYTVSVSISGDLSKRELSEVERNNLYAAILTLMDLFGIPVENVWGHNEYPNNKTACPCIDMTRVRNDLLTLQHRMIVDQSGSARRGRAFDVMNQTKYMYSLIGNEDGNEKWALSYFDEFHSFLKSKNLL